VISKKHQYDRDRCDIPLSEAAKNLAERVKTITFSLPVTHVYNPLDYAWGTYSEYLERYARTRKRVLFLGMNPGPWGMAQTGIPFGEINYVRDWLKINGDIDKPENEHPKRKITGFACPRSEVSGRRLWSLFSNVFGSPDRFFKDHFVANYCPLVFMEDSGRNRTPDKLTIAERNLLFEVCDEHLARTVEILKPEWLIGIGGFAEKRLFEAVSKTGMEFSGNVGKILHPSPASPAANSGWEERALHQLQDLGVWSSN